MEQLYSFWSFLNDNKIAIPIIQRDYAQGREDKVELRRKFLNQLKDALIDEPIFLDFVYGSVENGILYPLDGQQRLTTLWLLHWFFAYKTGTLSDPGVQERLSNFTYQTRQSSSDFCKSLCKLTQIPAYTGLSLFQIITRQRWFFSSFLHDPTIQAMLRMLSNANGDCIETIFADLNPAEVWAELTSDNCPIRFYHKGMQDENMPLTDDLYIKMNARGKKLTEFENFKAELFEFEIVKDHKLFDPEIDSASFISKFENEWTNLFWEGHQHPLLHRIDELFLKFLNRFLLNRVIVSAAKADELDNDALFRHFYNGEEFVGLGPEYSRILNEGFKKSFSDTMDGILYVKRKGLNDVNSIFPEWLSNDNPSILIPDYIIDDSYDTSVTPITPRGRVLFYAACAYFENISQGAEYSSSSLHDWIRFANNLSLNPKVDSPQTVIACIKNLADYAHHANDIMSFLCSKDTETLKRNTEFERQLVEEIEKAKYIEAARSASSSKAKEDEIYEAERFAFFNSSIRSLYRNENGVPDWSSFPEKFKQAKTLFAAPITSRNNIQNAYSRLSLRFFISLFTNWDDLRYHCVFDSLGATWKEMLTDDGLKNVTHLFFTKSIPTVEDLKSLKSPFEGKRAKAHYDLYATDFLECTTWQRFILWEDWEQLTHLVYPKWARSDYKMYYIGNYRNDVLTSAADLGLISFRSEPRNQRLFDTSFCWGTHIDFKYVVGETVYYFQWRRDNAIWMTEKDDKNDLIEINDDLKMPANDIRTAEELQHVLSSLVSIRRSQYTR